MKIYFVDPNNTTPQVNYPLLETLSKLYENVDVTYFSSNYSEHTDYYDKNYKFKKRYIFPKFINKIESKFLRRFLKIFSHLLTSKFLLFTAIIRKPEIVHYNWLVNPFFDYFIIWFLKLFGIKVVITQHNYYQHGKEHLRFFEKNIFRIVDSIISLSQYVANRFDSEFKDKITVIEHGNTYEKDVEINKTFSVHSDKIRIVFIGGIFPYKGLENLISAIALLNNENILLYILGDGDKNYIDKIKQKILLHGLEDITFFEKDYVSYQTIFNTIRNSSFGVLPYKKATQSGVPFLFYNLHKPVILTNVGGLAENIDTKFTKVVTPNVDELAIAIDEMIKDIKNGKIRDRDFEDFLYKHKWENTVKKYYELYRYILL